MPGCDPVGAEKPHVWKDEDRWKCSQTIVCRKCKDIWWEDSDEDDALTWEQAMEESRNARPVPEPQHEAATSGKESEASDE